MTRIVCIALAVLVAPLTVQAQTGAAAAAPRTADGRPDLQGVWDFRTITPLQRPAALGDKAVLTAEEAAQTEAQWANIKFFDRPAREGEVIAYNDFWLDLGTTVVGTRRTSLIVDPSDGRLPPLVPNVPRQVASLDADLPGERPVLYRAGGIGADGPEDRGVGVRCILGFNSGPPMMPSGYNNNMQLFQTPDHVVVLTEMVHDARIIPLDGRAHLPEDVQQWNGDSRGHWDGDTLVVETTNFTGKTASFNDNITTAIGTGETLHLTERFTRVDAETLLYEYTIDDPTAFTRPFTVAQPMRKNSGQIFEYACHEGNYGMTNMLTGARIQEQAAADAARPD
ncbi:MAG: hypothetical protein E2P06_13140 [Acidobacteria bacterium]|nr:MAG: hypothetical protein E2P06_13140 [Acidobacteriota bacterium]